MYCTKYICIKQLSSKYHIAFTATDTLGPFWIIFLAFSLWLLMYVIYYCKHNVYFCIKKNENYTLNSLRENK